jgi:carboxypeptidase C (cathepsin A)
VLGNRVRRRSLSGQSIPLAKESFTLLKSHSLLAVVSVCLFSVLASALCSAHAAAQDSTKEAAAKEAGKDNPKAAQKPDAGPPAIPNDSTTQGSVSVEGHTINYQAVAGTILVAATNDADAALGMGAPPVKPDEKEAAEAPPTARIFYVAYFKKDAPPDSRPVTFIYNGGPGSSSLWLHMGAFGPQRIITADDQHTSPAPYQLVDNAYSLLDVSDLVFIDAPGTGFGRLFGKEKEKAFWGIDQDGHAFARFIARFLSKYQRWNSPKYLFGESYGTTRSAVVAGILETESHIDLNGVILLSQILNFDDSADAPQLNPGIDVPYELALPTFAATAWYHKRLPTQPAALDPFLAEVEQFALSDYASALAQGSQLPEATRQAIAEKLHQYTGLPVAYILKADLRINVGQFNHNLQGSEDLTTGRLDSRFSGPTIDPLAEEAAYDPQATAIASAYVSAFNDYVRRQLKFGEGLTYLAESEAIENAWDNKHRAPGAPAGAFVANVMPDLAVAMKYNPRLKVMLNGGYFDLATPFFAARYEMYHLPIPANLRQNIEYSWYESGHMVYVHEAALKELHDKVAEFITSNYKPVK